MLHPASRTADPAPARSAASNQSVLRVGDTGFQYNPKIAIATTDCAQVRSGAAELGGMKRALIILGILVGQMGCASIREQQARDGACVRLCTQYLHPMSMA